MPHDPARVAETREWFQKAALDFRGARIDLDAQPPLLEDVLFHCQQAVEKADETVPKALRDHLS